MQRHATKPAPDVPKGSALLVEAVNKPGLIMEAYSAFHNYSPHTIYTACTIRIIL